MEIKLQCPACPFTLTKRGSGLKSWHPRMPNNAQTNLDQIWADRVCPHCKSKLVENAE